MSILCFTIPIVESWLNSSINLESLPSLKLTACPWKWMLGKWFSFWGGLFSRAMSVLGRVTNRSINFTPRSSAVHAFFSISECQSKTRSAATAAKGFTFAPNVEQVRKSIRKSYLDYLVSFPRKIAIAREVLKSIHTALIRQCNILSLVILWYHQPGIARP